ncbi:septal ring lytic transglycosylase RlpA family protein [bacterium]|nr:septal ring lytic transglycosylase RlpA family protein [bacterium]
MLATTSVIAEVEATMSAPSAPARPAAFATYETTKGRHGTSRVWIGDRQVFVFDGDDGTMAKRVSDKLIALNKQGALRAERIMPGRRKKEKLYVVSVGGEDLLTFDQAFANRQGTPPTTLALRYVSQLRDALGGRSLQQQIAQTASRGGYGRQQVGVASWYGGFFHGRRAADGSRFDQNDFTAAHKTLPFGTLLLVTNLTTQQSTLVRVSDRGPYIPGRMIDLSRGAAKAIGMLGSGVSKVRVTIFKPKQ